jgi:hypothetical protein
MATLCAISIDLIPAASFTPRCSFVKWVNVMSHRCPQTEAAERQLRRLSPPIGVSLWVQGFFESLASAEDRNLSCWYANLRAIFRVVTDEFPALRNSECAKVRDGDLVV